MTGHKVMVFFYGSFINVDVLGEVDLVPESVEVAELLGYDIVIRPLANLVRSPDASVFGILVGASHAELERLYRHAEQVLGGVYKPHPVIVHTSDDRQVAALCYLSHDMAAAPATDDYIDRIVIPAKSLGFPSWYIERLQSFRPDQVSPASDIPAIEELMNMARNIKRGHERGDPESLELIRKWTPAIHRDKVRSRFAQATDDEIRSAFFTAVDACHTVARMHGFPHWGPLIEANDRRLNPHFEAAVDAIVEGDLENLRHLLKKHPRLVHERSGRRHRSTLLHYVSANGVEGARQKTPPNAVAIAELLLQSGAEADAIAMTYDGGDAQTPLYLLVSSDHPRRAGLSGALVETYVRHGANPNGISDDGLPLSTALIFGITPAAEALVDCGARCDHVVLAAGLGRLDLVRACVDEKGQLIASQSSIHNHHLDTPDDPRDVLGMALCFACKHRRLEVIDYLLSVGVDPSSRGQEDQTGLHWAAVHGWKDVATRLLEHGADITARDLRWNSSPLGWAVECSHPEMVDLFMQYGSVDLIDAIDLDRMDLVRKALVEDKVSADGPKASGVPLRLAADKGAVEIVKLLLECGANPRLRSNEGRTALDWARDKGHEEVVKLLQ